MVFPLFHVFRVYVKVMEKRKKQQKQDTTMDSSSEPDIIRIRRPVIDERPDGSIALYFHTMPPDGGLTTKIDTSGWQCDPGDWPIND